MDDIGSHISIKIRSAIKAKLVELGIYVDNELPDYIMVLVVNKKPKEQMDNDLSLFLGHNTEHFTSWLTNVLEKLSSAAAASNAPAITAPPTEKPIEKEKENKPKEEVKSLQPPQKEEVKKVEIKKLDSEAVIKDTKEKDKKKSKEKKHEKKEKKRKKKEKKDLEKKLKKEAKKKAALDAEDKSVKETNGAITQTIALTAKPATAAPTPELKSSIPVSIVEGRGDGISSSKRKRDTSDSDKEGDRAGRSPVSTKRAVVESHGAGGKHKTLTITKTIHNDHHKPSSGKDSSEERSPCMLAKTDDKTLSPSSTPSSTTVKKGPLKQDKKKAKKTLSSTVANSSDEIKKKKGSLDSASKHAAESEASKSEQEEFIDEIEEEVEEEIEEDEVGEADKLTVEEEEEEEEEEVEEEVVEEHIEVEEEEEEEEIEETVEDIVDMKVDERDELEQEMQEDGAVELSKSNKTAADKHKERKSSKVSRSSRSSSSKRQSKQPLSVMDRLGPPRHSKRARSSERRSGDRDRRSDDRHSADDDSSREARAAKRRLVNLLEESSFPPRRQDKKPMSSRVVASVPPSKRLEARVRPMSVVERSGRNAQLSPPRSQLASVVARHPHQGSDASASDSDDQARTLPTTTSTVQSKVEVSSSSSRDRRGGGGSAAQSSSSSNGRRAPNTALILRAVADAHRSVTTAKRTNAHLGDDTMTDAPSSTSSSKKPKMEVFSRSYREREEGRLNTNSTLKEAKIKKLSITVPNTSRSSAHKEKHSVSDIADIPVTERLGRSSRSAAATLSKRVSSDAHSYKHTRPVSSSVLGDRVESSSRSLSHYSAADAVMEDEDVTTSSSRVKARLHNPSAPAVVAAPVQHNMEEVEEYIEEVEEWEEDVESVDRASISDPVGVLGATAAPSSALLLPLDQIVQQNAIENKYSTRCMFWPACRLGEKCQYQHPTLPCKMFPNCTFGDKCLYIHPNCKYDALCTRVDCPFTHASPRSLSTTVIPAKSKLSLSTIPVPPRHTGGGVMSRRCLYGPKCSNVNCPFLHPKPCKYGSSCLTTGCQFSHPDFTTGAKLRWVAPKVAAAAAAAGTKQPQAPGKDGPAHPASAMTYTASAFTLNAAPTATSKLNPNAAEWKKSAVALLAAKTKLAAMENDLAVKRSAESELTSNGCSTVKSSDEIVKPKITPITAD